MRKWKIKEDISMLSGLIAQYMEISASYIGAIWNFFQILTMLAFKISMDK